MQSKPMAGNQTKTCVLTRPDWRAGRGWRLAGIAVLAAVGWSSTSYGDDLILWNRLGSRAEAIKSARGPRLHFYRGKSFPDGQGKPAYAPGMFGNALTIGPGEYTGQLREHTIVFERLDQYLNADRGTIEVWYKQMEDPVPWKSGVHRIFDGAYGLGSGLAFDVEYSLSDSKPWLVFGLDFGSGRPILVKTDITHWNGQWVHLAGVWDRNGIAGSADKIRLYVNGEVAASSTSSGWGHKVGPKADICGGNDAEIAGKFSMDNLKVYDYAMTDFSHRFQEDWVPTPAASTPSVGHHAGTRVRITIELEGDAPEVVVKDAKGASKVMITTQSAEDSVGDKQTK